MLCQGTLNLQRASLDYIQSTRNSDYLSTIIDNIIYIILVPNWHSTEAAQLNFDMIILNIIIFIMYMITGIIIIIDLISWINSFGLVLHLLIGARINIVELAIYIYIYIY